MPVPVVKVSVEDIKSKFNTIGEAKSYFDSLVDLHQKNTKNSSMLDSIRATQAAINVALNKMDSKDCELYQSVLDEYGLMIPPVSTAKNSIKCQKEKIISALDRLTDEEIKQVLIDRQRNKITALINEKSELQKKMNFIDKEIENLTGRSVQEVLSSFLDDEVLAATKKICNKDPLYRTPCSISEIASMLSKRFPQWSETTLRKKIGETLDLLSEKKIVSKENNHYYTPD